MFRAVTFLVTVPLLAVGAGAQPDDKKPVEFITKAGTYKLFDGKLVVEVTAGTAGTTYTITRAWGKEGDLIRSVSSFPTKAEIKKGAAWFIYPESTSKVWVFTGEQLVLGEYTEKENTSESKISDASTAPGIVKAAPEAVRKRLPEEFKKKYSGAEEEEPRLTLQVVRLRPGESKALELALPGGNFSPGEQRDLMHVVLLPTKGEKDKPKPVTGESARGPFKVATGVELVWDMDKAGISVRVAKDAKPATVDLRVTCSSFARAEVGHLGLRVVVETK